MKNTFLALLTILTVSCTSQETKREKVSIEAPKEQESSSQIGEYVVKTFQDSNGTLWFGTLEEGIAKYDGATLVYLTTADGLPSNRVVDVIEDNSGNLWFATDAGISKFDGKTFTNYSEEDGLCSNMISNLFIDSKGKFWIGTWGGVCTFNGTSFEDFPIPYPTITTKMNPDTKDWITAITEDSNGHIWIGRDGYGASRFDGSSMVHFTTTDGLNSNNVQTIIADQEGTIWIGTRVAEKDNPDAKDRFGKGGLNKYDGKRFTQFTEVSGLADNDVYAIYEDHSNKLWVSSISNGVYKFANGVFTNYQVPTSTMSFLSDRQGTMWLGCAGGLYRIDTTGQVMNITTNGPWE